MVVSVWMRFVAEQRASLDHKPQLSGPLLHLPTVLQTDLYILSHTDSCLCNVFNTFITLSGFEIPCVIFKIPSKYWSYSQKTSVQFFPVSRHFEFTKGVITASGHKLYFPAAKASNMICRSRWYFEVHTRYLRC